MTGGRRCTCGTGAGGGGGGGGGAGGAAGGAGAAAAASLAQTARLVATRADLLVALALAAVLTWQPARAWKAAKAFGEEAKRKSLAA